MTTLTNRGPLEVRLADGGSLDLWYDSGTRFWILQRKDAEGNQTGPGIDKQAAYHHSRADAVDEMRELLATEAK